MANPIRLGIEVEADTSKADFSDVVGELDAAKAAKEELDDAMSKDVELDADISKYEAALRTAEDDVDRLRRDLADAIELDLDTADIKKELRGAEADVKAMRKVVDAEAKKMEDDLDIEATIDVDSVRAPMRDASETTAEFKDEARQNFGEVTSSFTGEMDSLFDVAQGTLGGLAGTLTGPLGVALGAAAAGVGLIYGGFTKAAEEAEELRAESQELADALIEAGSSAEAIADAVDGASYSLSATNRIGAFGEVQSQAADLVTLLDAGVIAADDLNAALYGDDPAAVSRAWRDISSAVDETSGVVLKGTGEWTAADHAMQDTMDAANRLSGSIADQSDKFDTANNLTDDAVTLNERLSDELGTTAAEQEAYNEQLAAAEEGLDAAKAALDEYLGVMPSAQAALDDMKTATNELGEANLDAALDTDEFSAANVDGRKKLRDSQDAAKDYIRALVDTGGTSKEAASAARQYNEDLRKQARQAGLTEDQVDDLIREYGLVPEDIETDVKAIDKATDVIDRVKREDIPDKNFRILAQWAVPELNLSGRVSNGVLRPEYQASATRSAARSADAAPQAINLVRVNIGGREVRAEVESINSTWNSSRTMSDLLFTGGRP